MSNQGNYPTSGPSEGTWSVFAEKVVAERDALAEDNARLRREVLTLEKERGEVNEALKAELAEIERLRPLVGLAYPMDCGHPEACWDDDAEACAVCELAECLRRMLAVYEALMPGVRHIAVKDYQELNEAPVAARAALAKVKA